MDGVPGRYEPIATFRRQRFAKPRTVVIPIGFANYSDRPEGDVYISEFLPLGHESLLHRALNEAATAGAERVIFVVRPDLKGLQEGVRSTILRDLLQSRVTGHSSGNSGEKIRRLAENALYLYLDGPQSIDTILCRASQWITEHAFAVLMPLHVLFDGQTCDQQELHRLACLHQNDGQSLLGLVEVDWENAILGTSFDIQPNGSGGYSCAGIQNDDDRANENKCLLPSGRAIIGTHLLKRIWEGQRRQSGPDFVRVVQVAQEIAAPIHAHLPTLDLIECNGQFGYGRALRRLHTAASAVKDTAETSLPIVRGEIIGVPERRSGLG